MFKTCLLALFVVGMPIVAPLEVRAEPVTISGLTVDLPDGFKASESDRGLLAETADGEAYLWVEAFNNDDAKTLMAEHDEYWEKQGVNLGGAPEKTIHDNGGGITTGYLDFSKATWKGEPTIVRYVQYGPYGAEKKMILLTYWATPKSDAEHGAAINKLVANGVKFNYKQ